MDLSSLSHKQKTDYFHYLSEFITLQRLQKIEEVSLQRTRHLTIILEDIYQSHNASAVLRSCDCFGIQDVHIIENEYPYQVNPDVALGSAQWLNIFKYNSSPNNTAACIDSLKQKGYRIVAASPHRNDCAIGELPLEQKTALLFGTELKGLTEEALELADAFVKIPMSGFTESLNISVSAAICLFSITGRLRQTTVNWRLDENELIDLRISWIKNNIKKADIVEHDYFAHKSRR